MSEVILDTITGKSTATTITIGSTPVVSASANSMTIRGEGSAQTSIQQGLAKMWALGNEGSGSLDSFNNSGTTDNGTGDYTKAFTNSFSSDNIACVGTSAGDNTRNYIDTQTRATGSIQIRAQDQSASAQDSRIAMGIWGDLA
jgi:hypothetical protein|tara:strand:- start:446 stop:874 length:429 start_codon:yes stop_codon:yes gene_type:complete